MCYRLWCQISCPPENIGFINHVVGDSKKASNIVLESGLPRLIFGKQGRHIGSHISSTPPLLPPLSILQHPGKALGLGGLASCGGPVSNQIYLVTLRPRQLTQDIYNAEMAQSLSSLQKSEFLKLIISLSHYFFCQNWDQWHKMSEKNNHVYIFSTFGSKINEFEQKNYQKPKSCRQFFNFFHEKSK